MFEGQTDLQSSRGPAENLGYNYPKTTLPMLMGHPCSYLQTEFLRRRYQKILDVLKSSLVSTPERNGHNLDRSMLYLSKLCPFRSGVATYDDLRPSKLFSKISKPAKVSLEISTFGDNYRASPLIFTLNLNSARKILIRGGLRMTTKGYLLQTYG